MLANSTSGWHPVPLPSGRISDGEYAKSVDAYRNKENSKMENLQGNIQKIAQEATELAEKKTWIKQGLQSLFFDLNSVPEIETITSDFSIEAIVYDEGAINLFLQLETKEGAYFHLVKAIDTAEEQIFHEIYPLKCDSNLIRKVIENLPSAIKSIAEQLELKNEDYASTAQLLKSMLSSIG